MLSNKNYKTYLIVILFLTSMFGSFILFNISPTVNATSSEWWNSDWTYRRKIEIENNLAEELTDYQVLIELNASEYIGKSLPDGNDIRFTKADHATELDFWIETWDEFGTTNRIWVKIPSLPASSTVKIFMYYGNSNLEVNHITYTTGFEFEQPLLNGWVNIEDGGSTTFDITTSKKVSGFWSGYVSRDTSSYYNYRTDKWVGAGEHAADGTSFTGHIYATYGTSTNAYLYPIFVDWNNYIALRLYSDKVYIESKISGSYTYTQKSLGTQFYGKWWEFSISISESYASAWVESGSYYQSLGHSWSGNPGIGYAALRTRSWWAPYYFDDLELTYILEESVSNGFDTFLAFDDFQSYVDGQNIDGKHGWIDSSDNFAAVRNIDDNMVLEVERTSSSDRDNIGYDWNIDQECIVHFDLYPDLGSYIGYMYAYQYSGTNIAFVKGQGNDDWYWYDGSSLHSFSPYMYWSFDEWKTYDYILANNDLKCYAGGSGIHDGGLRNPYTTGIDQWRWQGHGTYNSRFYVDNFYVRKYASTEPTIILYEEDEYTATPEKIAVFFYDGELIADKLDDYIDILENVGYTKIFIFDDSLNVQEDCQIVDDYECYADTIFVYIMGHGNFDGEHSYTAFRYSGQTIVYSNEFKEYMDAWEAERKCLLVESCFSGGWAEDFNDSPYLVMTSADENHTSWMYNPLSPHHYEGVFSHYFFEHVEAGYNAVDSFYYAEQYVMEEELLYSYYDPHNEEWIYCQPQYPKIYDNSVYTWFV